MSEASIRFLLLLHVAATLFMVGVIWFVQVVHYPLLARVGTAEVPDYQKTHTRRTAWVVAPPMFLEMFTGLILLGFRPDHVPLAVAVLGVALIVVVWLSTQFLQIPCHERLTIAFDPAVHRRLVATNWLRTAVWSLRGILVLGMA